MSAKHSVMNKLESDVYNYLVTPTQTQKLCQFIYSNCMMPKVPITDMH